jgi:putative MATE family efflux protein
MKQKMKINKNKSNDMTVGNPLKLILIFAIPILIGNVFQQMYNVVDTAVIGHVLGDKSLAAIGATSAIFNLIVGFANGTTNGFSVVLARFYGARDEAAIKKTVGLIVLLTFLASAVLTIVSLLGMIPLLKFLKTPPEIIGQASIFLKIILQFSFITMLYNMFAGMLRAIGNSKAPLIFLVIAVAINIVLDILFIKYLGFGIAGAAYATVISQFVSVCLCINYIRKNCPILYFKKKYLVMDKELIKELVTTGLSMGLMFAIVSVGTVALQSAVNSFGANTIAAHTAARKIDDIFMLPIATLSMAAATYASQNYGAGKLDRVKEGVKNTIMLAFIWSAFSNIVVFFGCDFMVSAITGTKEPEVFRVAARYIHINVPFFFMLSILVILRSSLQGLGRKIVPLCASIVELIAKFVAVGFLAPWLGYFGICILEPIVWGVCMMLVVIDFYNFSKNQICFSSDVSN